MSDDIDLAQQHEEMHRAHAIAAALERPRRAGRPLCLECEEPISPDRQALGADLCPECQGFAFGVAVMSLTPEQLHILQDPLGMDFATPGEDRFADLRALVEAGLMVDAGSHPRSGGMHLFTITDAGERLVEELARGAQ